MDPGSYTMVKCGADPYKWVLETITISSEGENDMSANFHGTLEVSQNNEQQKGLKLQRNHLETIVRDAKRGTFNEVYLSSSNNKGHKATFCEAPPPSEELGAELTKKLLAFKAFSVTDLDTEKVVIFCPQDFCGIMRLFDENVADKRYY